MGSPSPMDAAEAARRYGRLKTILKRKLLTARSVIAGTSQAFEHIKEARDEVKTILSDMETCYIIAEDGTCADLDGFLEEAEPILTELSVKVAGLKIDHDKGKVKLSELKTPRFSGEISEYLCFKSDFFDLIVARTTDKIALIKLRDEGLTKGSPEHMLVTGSRTVSEAFQILDEQYSNAETQRNALLVKLRYLPKIERTNDAVALRQLVATLKSTIQKLDLIEQGEMLDLASFSLVMTKLPLQIRRDIDSEIYDHKHRKTEKKFQVLVEKCQRYAMLTETHAYRSKAYVYTKETGVKDNPSVQFMAVDGQSKCIFHPQGSKHRTPFCHKLNKLSAVDILDKVKEKGHCFRCLDFHPDSTECDGKCPEANCSSPFTHAKALHAASMAGLMSTMAIGLPEIKNPGTTPTKEASDQSDSEESDSESEASTMKTTISTSHTSAGEVEHSGRTTLRPAHVGYVKSSKGELISVNIFYDLGSDLTQVTYECIGKTDIIPVGHLECLNLLVAGSKKPVPFGRSDLFILPMYDVRGRWVYSLKCAAVPYIGRLRKVNISRVKSLLANEGHDTISILEPPSGCIDISVGCNMPQVHPVPIVAVNSLIIAECVFGRVFYGSHPTFQATEFSRAYLVSRDQQPVCLASELVDKQAPTTAYSSVVGEGKEKEWDLYDRLASIETGPCSVCSHYSFQGKDEPRRRAIYEECLEFLPLEQKVVARLPWATDLGSVPDNRHSALKRLEGITKSLQKDEVLKEAYRAEFEKMVSRGIVVEVSSEEQQRWKNQKGPVWYTAHFPVLNVNSSSTPVRVVFDASVPYRGFHLTKMWESPPNLIPDIQKMFLGFRERPIGFCLDFSKAYWTVFLRETESHMQRILWNNLSLTEPVQVYRMTRNSFGMVPSGAICSLAMCLVAKHYKDEHPRVYEFVCNRVYVDDGVSSCETIDDAIKLATDIRSVMSRGSFDLKHFVIGCPAADVRQDVPEFITFADSLVRILGVGWDTESDVLYLTCSINFSKRKRGQRVGPNLVEEEYDSKFPPEISLRMYLSVMASLFDPLGLSAPVSILLKHELGRLFELKLGWDEWVPHGKMTDDQPTYEKCKALLKLLYGISTTPFRRLLRPKEITTGSLCPTLVGFCDSSQTAYSACVYFNWPGSTENERQSYLVVAKSKPFPKRGPLLTIPRGELMSCLMLARLVHHVRENSSYVFDRIILMSDATIALHQINASPIRLKLWPAVRVEEIQTLTQNTAEWFHIPSGNNIADCATRGLNPSEIGPSSPWQNGPLFMTKEIDSWPIEKVNSAKAGESKGHDALMEVRPYPSMSFTPVVRPLEPVSEHVSTVMSLGIENSPVPIEKFAHGIIEHVLCLDFSSIERISDWMRLRRAVARILRFLADLPNLFRNRNKLVTLPNFSELTRKEQCDWIYLNDRFVPSMQEMKIAVIILVKKAQQNLSGKFLASIKKLKPAADSFGLWRALGRVHSLKTAPYIIPAESPLARTLLVWFHRRSHSGSDSTLALTREWFWIIRGQVLSNRVVSDCAICRRRRKKTVVVEMAPLDVFRFERAPVFSTIFIDLCGPYPCKADRRATRTNPALSGMVWILVIVCAVTHAVQLEVVEGYDTENFISALDNFISFRSRPARIIADRGSQIKAAAGALQPLWTTVNVSELQNHLCDSTEWIFAPPGAHAFIGMAERMVKTVKESIQVMTCAQKPLLEKLHFSRLLYSIANLINDRPLTVGRNRVSKLDDFRLIRPNDLLFGRSSASGDIAWEEVDVDDLPSKRSQFLNLLEQKRSFLNQFWTKFQTVVFHTLLPACKWLNSGRSIQVHDVVLIKDTNPVRGIWTLGQVEQVFCSEKDGQSRRALVRYKEALGKEPKNKSLISKSKTVIKCVRDVVIILEHTETENECDK